MLKKEVVHPPPSVATEFAIVTFTAIVVALAAALGIIETRNILLSSSPHDHTAERLLLWLDNQTHN